MNYTAKARSVRAYSQPLSVCSNFRAAEARSNPGSYPPCFAGSTCKGSFTRALA
ncbi:unnamed protein product [Ixodes pacificus]